MGVELAVREPSSLVEVSDLHDYCGAIEAWASECDSIPELQDGSNKLAAVNEYLVRTSKDGRARVEATMRRLELRIGDLLGPALPGSPGNEGRMSLASDIAPTTAERNKAMQFRKMAGHRQIVEAVIAEADDQTPATRRRVLGAIHAELYQQARRMRDEGHSHREIADALGIAQSAVARAVGCSPGTKPPPGRSAFHYGTPHIKTTRIVEQTFYALDGLGIGIKEADVEQLEPAYAAAWAGNLRAAVSRINDFIRSLDQRSREHGG